VIYFNTHQQPPPSPLVLISCKQRNKPISQKHTNILTETMQLSNANNVLIKNRPQNQTDKKLTQQTEKKL
jgi:hypothetical protein